MKTILSTRGYKISKRYITNKQIELIKKDLIIKPYTFDMTGFNDKSKEDEQKRKPVYSFVAGGQSLRDPPFEQV